MPLKEFICAKCGIVFEKLTKTEENTYKCPVCGQISSLNYTGKCNYISGGNKGCKGSCKNCSGCKH